MRATVSPKSHLCHQPFATWASLPRGMSLASSASVPDLLSSALLRFRDEEAGFAEPPTSRNPITGRVSLPSLYTHGDFCDMQSGKVSEKVFSEFPLAGSTSHVSYLTYLEENAACSRFPHLKEKG